MKADDILLIGGGGFIGSALARRLQAEGRRMHVISPNLEASASPWITCHKACMSDPGFLKKILPRCRTIVHAASATTPGSSARHPSIEGQRNITPSLKLIEALASLERFHLIFISSGGAVYGDPDTLPATEEHPLRPKSFYAAAKITLEGFFRLSARPPLGAVTIARPANVYGPGQALRPGFGIIRTMLAHMADGSPMEIWGGGEAFRDYVYIDDMVDALAGLIEMPEDQGIYNIGSGVGVSLNRLCQLAQTVVGRRLVTRYREGRRSDVSGIFLDSSRLQAKTGWRPKVTLEEGILSTWQWLSALETSR